MGPKPDHGEESYRGSDRLTGKRAIITGGDSGIGRAVALAFAREGADVLITYLADEEEKDARETVRLIEQAGRTGVAVPCDLREEAQLPALGRPGGARPRRRRHPGQQRGVPDVAGQRPRSTSPPSSSTGCFKTNVYAMFWLCKFALPHMKEGSTIINTSSIQAFDPSPQLLDYATTKAAIANFTKALAQNLADRGIRVNAVAPGPIWTPLIPATMPEEKVKQFGTDTPLGRPGQPAELAPAYVYFASQESSYVTGEILGVTGGRPTK